MNLPEYPSPYQVFALEKGAPLLEILAEHPLVCLRVPDDLRRQVPLFNSVQSQITRTVHSQPPHHDHPHPSGDPRQFNLFWAERPRAQAATVFFVPEATPMIAETLTRFMCGNAEAWQRSLPFIQLYQREALRLSRYRLPAQVVEAYTRLLRDGDKALWNQLSHFGQTTVTTRIYSNHVGATHLLQHIMNALPPEWVTLEFWAEPLLVLADDTWGTHARWGMGESGGHFYRTWLAMPEDHAFPHDLAYFSSEPQKVS